MSIIVQRQPADKAGPAIVSSVLTTTDSQLEAGTHEINSTDTDREKITGTIPDTLTTLPGDMAKLIIKGIEKTGLVNSIKGSIRFGVESISIRTQIVVETIK